MSVIIDFPARDLDKTARRGDAGPCEVVIFPGVRIERREFNIADRMANVRRRPAVSNHAEDLDLI
jgi:hypothetical protein